MRASRMPARLNRPVMTGPAGEMGTKDEEVGAVAVAVAAEICDDALKLIKAE
jgi:hypothetical protein